MTPEQHQRRLETQKRYRERHRDELRAKGRAYARKRYAEDEEFRERAKARIQELVGSDEYKATQRKSYEKHAAKRRAERLRYREHNLDREREYSREWYSRNRERCLAYAAEYRAKNPEKAAEATRRWFACNPEKKRQYDSAYRARKVAADGSFTAREFRQLCEQSGNRCWYCGTETSELTIEHVVPLSRGGANSFENIVPACRPCNSAKRDKPLDEFVESRWFKSRAA